MREILFRGKRKDNGEWETGFLIGRYDPMQKENVIKSAFIDNGTCFYDPVEVIPETVEQYIGLTDKNGNKIFEGDIINTYTIYGVRDYKNAVVRLDDVLMCFMADKHSLYGGLAADIYEVIGNIHDNPELLKE